MSKNPRMRAVTTAQSMRRSYNKVIDGDGNSGNPYKSMYSQAFGARDDRAQAQAMFSTPQKSHSKRVSRGGNQTMGRTREDQLRQYNKYPYKRADSVASHRKYGEYSGAEGYENLDQSIQSNTIGGYNGGRRTRCTDKFVRYPYPRTLLSGYQKDYKDKLKSTTVMKNGDAFNLEKEAKIINPHKMDLATTNGQTYKNFEVIPKKKELRRPEDDNKPIMGESSYQKSFPNWKNGTNDIYHEKHPQYPFYSLPFKGESNYQQNFTEEQQQRLKQHNSMLKQIGQKSHAIIGLSQYKPLRFENETTNQKAYQGFKLQQRPKVQTQKVAPVISKANPAHFDTFNKKEFIKHNYKVSKLDFIPYP